MVPIGVVIGILILLMVWWTASHRRYSLRYKAPFSLDRKRTTSTQRECTEDLLKYLYTHTEEVAIESLAQLYALPPQRILELLDELVERDYLNNDRRTLTPLGKRAAANLLRRHRLYETYLCERTGIPPSEWHSIAERMEHLLDDHEADLLARSLGYPTRDPHGDPIPQTPENEPPHPASQQLSAITHTGWYEVVLLVDKTIAIFKELDQLGFYPSALLQVTDKHSSGIWVKLDNERFFLPNMLAAALLVSNEPVAAPTVSIVRLSALPLGIEATVYDLAGTCRGINRRRLLDLGFVRGSSVSVDLVSPLGNPRGYLIRGTTIALRYEQAHQIRVVKQNERQEDAGL